MEFNGKTENNLPLYLGSLQSVAFVKPMETETGKVYAVCSAEDAQVLATYHSKDAAFFAAIQHDMQPVMIH